MIHDLVVCHELLTMVVRVVKFSSKGGGTVRQAVGEVQSLELHQYKVAMVVSTIMIKNKVFLQYIMVFNEILSHNLYLFI